MGKPRYGGSRHIHAAVAVLVALVALPAPASALPRRAEVDTYRSNLDFPVDLAWVKGTKKIFFTEKSGKVRVMKGRRLLRRACVKLDVNDDGERGALGIALHPRFSRNHWLYVYYTNASPLENRVTRFRVRHNRCRSPRHIATGLDASSSGYHNGGQLEFVGNKLFVATGDAHRPAEAQTTTSRLGKVLRYNADGSVPDGNPFGNAVWSFGHRNPFGLARKPGTNRLYETENGPQCDDELNLIRKGRNYGWGPTYECGGAGDGVEPKRPLFRWSDVVVPTDAWWYRGRYRALSGSLYVGDYAYGRLHRFILNDRGTRVKKHRVIYDGAEAIVDVSKGPGGWLYLTTPSAIKRIVRR